MSLSSLQLYLVDLRGSSTKIVDDGFASCVITRKVCLNGCFDPFYLSDLAVISLNFIVIVITIWINVQFGHTAVHLLAILIKLGVAYTIACHENLS